jgi:hypothetical protein
MLPDIDDAPAPTSVSLFPEAEESNPGKAGAAVAAAGGGESLSGGIMPATAAVLSSPSPPPSPPPPFLTSMSLAPTLLGVAVVVAGDASQPLLSLLPLP